MCLITHKKYCGFFRRQGGNFSADLARSVQMIADAAGEQRWPGGVAAWRRDFEPWRGREPAHTFMRRELSSLALRWRAAEWEGAVLLQAVWVAWAGGEAASIPHAFPSARRRRRGWQHIQAGDGFASWCVWKPVLMPPHVGWRPPNPSASWHQEGWRCSLCLLVGTFHSHEPSSPCQAPSGSPAHLLACLWAAASLLCHAEIPPTSKSYRLYVVRRETVLCSEYRVQLSSILAILKTSQVLPGHRNVIFEAFPMKPDPEALGTQ